MFLRRLLFFGGLYVHLPSLGPEDASVETSLWLVQDEQSNPRGLMERSLIRTSGRRLSLSGSGGQILRRDLDLESKPLRPAEH